MKTLWCRFPPRVGARTSGEPVPEGSPARAPRGQFPISPGYSRPGNFADPGAAPAPLSQGRGGANAWCALTYRSLIGRRRRPSCAEWAGLRVPALPGNGRPGQWRRGRPAVRGERERGRPGRGRHLLWGRGAGGQEEACAERPCSGCVWEGCGEGALCGCAHSGAKGPEWV